MHNDDTIAAVATGTGGAIAVIRLSGIRAIEIGDRLFDGVSGDKLSTKKGFTIHYGYIRKNNEILDDVLVSLFRGPHSYTGEDMLEISCHASGYITQEILQQCIRLGARAAQPGEFTLRAFLAGKMDLSQAEAVADIIAADNKASHLLATQQMRGGYSAEFLKLRDKLIELASLLELELDFGEEDVEFADRKQLQGIIDSVEAKIQRLTSSFSLGNTIKKGVPVAIIGSPNVGKSTLLNAILNEEKALVSNIAGTTRDTIEDTINIRGINFRFIDTAGIRRTDDPLENLGIDRTYSSIQKASVILWLVDAKEPIETIKKQIGSIQAQDGQKLALVLNKIDNLTEQELTEKQRNIHATVSIPTFSISAKKKINLETLIDFLYTSVDTGEIESGNTVVFNTRHYEALQNAQDAILRAKTNLAEGISGDLLSQDIREVLHHLGTITGEITTDDILRSIFTKFCIGK